MSPAKAEHRNSCVLREDPLVKYLLDTKQVCLYSTLRPTASETQLSGINVRNPPKLGKDPLRYLDALRPATPLDSDDTILDRLECLLDFPFCAQDKLTPRSSISTHAFEPPKDSFPRKKNCGLRRMLNIFKSLRHAKKAKDCDAKRTASPLAKAHPKLHSLASLKHSRSNLALLTAR